MATGNYAVIASGELLLNLAIELAAKLTTAKTPNCGLERLQSGQ
jgi:hypothetical protein